MNRLDKQFEKIGFTKDEENEYGVHYRRHNEEHDYIQAISIVHKANGNHLIQSYEKEVNTDKFNNVVGLNYHEMKLLMKKYRQMKRKYHWK